MSGKKQAHKHKLNFLVRLLLGRPGECPGDKPRVLGKSGFVPGTIPGFLLVFYNGSPVSPRDNPGDEGAAERVYVLKDYVPFSLPRMGRWMRAR